jgi:hypothetical protein
MPFILSSDDGKAYFAQPFRTIRLDDMGIRKKPLQQCCRSGSGSTSTRIHLAVLDLDSYWECGSGSTTLLQKYQTSYLISAFNLVVVGVFFPENYCLQSAKKYFVLHFTRLAILLTSFLYRKKLSSNFLCVVSLCNAIKYRLC